MKKQTNKQTNVTVRIRENNTGKVVTTFVTDKTSAYGYIDYLAINNAYELVILGFQFIDIYQKFEI